MNSRTSMKQGKRLAVSDETRTTVASTLPVRKRLESTAANPGMGRAEKGEG